MKYPVSRKATQGYLVFTLLIPVAAWANCISPVVTPRECDFRNEDTNLWLYQPPLKWTSDAKVQTMIDTGKEFADHYMNSIKMTGDNATRYLLTGKAAAQETLIAIQTARAIAAEASNDPWNLKTIYTDIVCEVFWTTVEATTGVETGDCGFNWIAQGQTIAENAEAAQKIRDILNNPHLILGEEWGDLADDMDRVKAEYNELETMARNLTGPEMRAKIEEKFKTYEQMLLNPIDPKHYRELVAAEQDMALENTVRDIMMATQANAKNLFGSAAINDNDPNWVQPPVATNPELYKSDIEETRGLEFKNEFSVGRMQATEIGNMTKSLQGQAWMDIREQQQAMGYMIGLDMQKEIDDENHNTAWANSAMEELLPPQEELSIGDGVAIGVNPPAAFQ